MTTVKLSEKESVTITPKHGQVELHMVQGFLALSKRLNVTSARLVAGAILAACDQLTNTTPPSCPPCNGNCNQGRDCPARGAA